jgi:hypothetical protein
MLERINHEMLDETQRFCKCQITDTESLDSLPDVSNDELGSRAILQWRPVAQTHPRPAVITYFRVCHRTDEQIFAERLN